ncbi:BTB/POZ domain-containing protein 6-B-like isoform X1 [Cloeon dipterum]|uniref:BTB/POZ domain-containing protein 6-B-like isoform X1 n=1 Tax=Cloeon dipterum TaxID=197152 RepID=UPI00322068BF
MSTTDSEKWRKEHSTLADQLWYMYQHDLRTDLTIFVKDESKSDTFKCHQMVISRLSAAFDKLIQHACSVPTVRPSINLRFDPQLFLIVLKFAYTDEVLLQSGKEALSIYKLCKSYDIEHLALACEKYINSDLEADNIWQVFGCPNIGPTLTSQLRWFLGKNTSACLQSKHFLSCNQSSLLTLTAMPTLSIDGELELVKAVIKWTKHQNEGRALDPTVSKSLLGQALQHVRFLALTATEFSSHVAKSGLLSSDDSLALLVNLTCPGQMAVPSGLCANTEQRKKPLLDEQCENAENDSNEISASNIEEIVPAAEEIEEEKQEKQENVDQRNIPSFLFATRNIANRSKIGPNCDAKISKPTISCFLEPPFKPDPSKEVNPLGGRRSPHQESGDNSAARAKESDEPNNPVNVVRNIIPMTNNFTSEVEAPMDINIEFCVNQPARLISVKLMSQINRQHANITSYKENISVTIKTGESKKYLMSGYLYETVEFGPAPLEIKLKTPCILHANKHYLMQVRLRSAGKYVSHCRNCTVYAPHNLNVQFTSCDSGKGLLHSLILIAN